MSKGYDLVIRCYYCGRVIENENEMVMKGISTGIFYTTRKPFHSQCWEKYHEVQVKKSGIVVTLFITAVLAPLIVIGLMWIVGQSNGAVAVGLLFLLWILLIMAYFSIKEK